MDNNLSFIQPQDAWDRLSMKEKAEMMKVAVRNGITSLSDIRDKYNEFAEGGDISDEEYYSTMEKVAEDNYQKWGLSSPEEALVHVLNDNTYNYRGYYNKYPQSEANADTHWTDEFKTVYHPTFSVESRYSGEKSQYNPQGLYGGHWVGDTFAPAPWQVEKKHSIGGPLVDAAMGNVYGLGDWLRKGWNFIKNSAQVASVAENPAVMTAAGHRVTRNGKVAQDRQKDSNVENLRDNLFTLGEWSAVAPTLVGDVEAAYQVARHPTQTAKAIKEGAKEVARRAAEGLEQFAIKLGRNSDKASTLSNDAVNTALQTARDYKNSEGYKQLVRRSIEESKAIGTGDFPEETFFTGIHEQTPQVIMETRPKGRVASYNKTKNTINIDPEQVLEGEEVPFHEGLHWQRVGRPSLNIGPKYERWSSSVINNAPESERMLAFHDFYTSPEYAKYQQLENAEQFLEKKVANVLYDDVAKDSEMKKAYELIAHSMEAGKAQGIEPFTSYPGFQNAIEAIDKARKYDSFLYDIKAGSEEEVSNFWKLLTGNYIPSVVLGGVTAKTLKD